MKKAITGLLVFLLIAAAAGYFLYPVFSDQLAQRRDAETLRRYREKTAAMDAARKEALFAEAKEWNEALENIRGEDIFTEKNRRTTRDYQNRMNVHEGVLAELVIPNIGVSLPVYHLSNETPVNRYLVHVDTGSLPADGTGENIVLAGPGILEAEGFPGTLGLTDARMLEELDTLIPGDLMILNVLDRTMVYRVAGIQMLSSAGLKDLDLTPGEDEERLTLISRKKDRRVLVQAERVSIREARTLLSAQDEAAFPDNWQNVLLLGCPVLLAGLFVLWGIEAIRGRAYRLPDEGRKADREQRERKARETLEQITNDSEISEGEKS